MTAQQIRTDHPFTQEEVTAFHRDGYVIRRGLFSAEEVSHLNRAVNEDPKIKDAVYGLADRAGAITELALWHHLGDDMFAAVARSRRVVENLETVLGGEIAFYHSKLTLKRPKVGGAWEWHQDYGYWYRNGYLFPHMASVFIALDPSTRENGCLKVLKGSHQLGRVEHGVEAGQVGADLAYVKVAQERLETVDAEMEPGDALFFHANTLHASSANTSDRTRNVLLCCYNRADNPPFMNKPNNGHTPIEKLDDDKVMTFAHKPLDAERPFDRAAVA
ncbi:MAG: phytanoyl-CoA dioxygenase family protein [Pseudomonadota bacterium]